MIRWTSILLVTACAAPPRPDVSPSPPNARAVPVATIEPTIGERSTEEHACTVVVDIVGPAKWDGEGSGATYDEGRKAACAAACTRAHPDNGEACEPSAFLADRVDGPRSGPDVYDVRCTLYTRRARQHTGKSTTSFDAACQAAHRELCASEDQCKYGTLISVGGVALGDIGSTEKRAEANAVDELDDQRCRLQILLTPPGKGAKTKTIDAFASGPTRLAACATARERACTFPQPCIGRSELHSLYGVPVHKSAGRDDPWDVFSLETDVVE